MGKHTRESSGGLRSVLRAESQGINRRRVENSRNRLRAAARFGIESLEQRVLLTIAAPSSLLATPSSAPGGSPSLLLGWQDNSANETSFKIKRSTDGVNFSQIDTVSANVAAYSDTTVSAGTHYWYEVVASNASEDSTVSNVSDAVDWASSNVGTVTGGSASTSAGVTTIVTAGGGIGWIADDFRYDYRTLSGDGYIIAKVTGVQYTNPMARAGVMFRNTLSANSREVMMAITPGSGADFLSRSSDGANASDNTYSGYAAPYWVKLVREGSRFSGYISNNGTTWTLINQVNVSMDANIYVGLAASSSGYGASNTSTFDNVSVTRTDHSLPRGWTSEDIGSASFAGSARFYGNTFSFAVEASGQNVGGTSDAFQFAHYTMAGDGQIVARVASVQNGYALAKAGVMLRDGTGATARNVFLAISAGNGAVWQYRDTTGGNTTETWVSGKSAPYWVKVVRSGNTFTGYTSSDNSTWTQIGSTVTISGMSASLEVGLALSAAGYGSLNTSTFDNVNAPSLLTALAVHAHRIDLNWSDNSNYEDGFIVERSGDNGSTWSQVGQVTASGLIDTSVNPGTTYQYRVKAFISGGNAGNSAYTNVASASTTGLGDGVSATYYNTIDFKGTSVARVDQQVNLYSDNGQSPDAQIAPDTFSAIWTGRIKPAHATGTQTYTFYALADDGVRLWINNQLLIDQWQVQSPTEFSATIGLTAGQTYNLRVEYFQSHQTATCNLSWASTGIPKAIIPTAQLFSTGYDAPATPIPGNFLALAQVTPMRVELTWSDVSGETGYILYRSTNGGDTFTDIAHPAANATGYTDTNVVSGQTYVYRVVAIGPGGTGNADGIVATPADIFAPQDPAAAPLPGRQIRLTWTDASSNESGFKIERSANGGAFSLIGTVAENATSFIDDNGLTPGVTYTYHITAYGPGISSTAQTITGQVDDNGTTTGLAATYFKNADFSGGSVSRTETAINFNWGDRSPDATVPSDKFSAVFTGKIKPDIASGNDNYSFRVVADGGFRVWVNDHLMLNHWQDAPPIPGDANLDGIVDNSDFAIMYQHYGQTGGWAKGDFNGDNQINFTDFQTIETSYGHSQQPVQVDSEAAISLTANQQYSIRVEYFDASLFASLKLFWSHGGSGFTLVPQSALVPTGFTSIPGRPVIATASPQTPVREGDTLNYDLHAYDPDGGSVTYALVSPDINQLPSDVTWTPRADGTATISYTPASGTEDPIPVVVEVTDDEGQKTRQGFTLIPSPKTAPTISAVPNATIYTGESYTPTVQVLDPGYTSDAVTFTLFAPGGQVPSWISIDQSGHITAAPQAGNDRPQPYRLEVQATNAHGAVAIQDFDLTIRTDRKPTVRMTVSNTTVALGQSLTFHLTATDGRGTPNLSLSVNNTVLTINGNGDATWTPTSANLGDVDAFATATDPVSGLQDNSVPIKFRVYDPNASAGTQRLHVPEDATFYLNKIPVEVSRIYDTADAANSLDFGKGWHLDLGIQDVLKGEFNQLDHAGQHLVVTLPNGKPEGFTFRPRFVGRDQSISADTFVPDFVPDDGVTSTLSAREDDGSGNAEKLYRLDGASDYTLVDQFTEFEPEEFSLTTTSGFTYHITSAATIDTVTDANGNHVDFSDASSGIIRGFDANSVETDINITRPAGQITQIQQGGRTISYTYDPTTGDLKTVTDAVSGFPSDTWTTQYTYNSGSQLKLITRGANTALSVTYGAGAAITAAKDGLNRDVPVLTAASQSDLKTSSHSLDDGTLLVRTFVQDGNGNPVTEIDPEGNRIDRTFVNGRIATYTQPYRPGDTIRMNQLDYTSDGWSNITRETDPAGRSIISTWLDDKLLTRIDPLGNTSTNVVASSEDHKILSSIDELGNQITYSYWNNNDPLSNGRLKDIITPTGVTHYSYPTASIITATDLALDRTSSSFFDADGALTGTQMTDRNGTVQADRTGRFNSLQSQGKTFIYTPDPNGNPILDSGPAGATQYTYDSRGRLVSTSTPVSPFSMARVITVFDVVGRVSSTSDPLGIKSDSVYDRDNHVLKTVLPDSTPATSTDNPFTQSFYNASGSQQSTLDEYGNSTTYLYDAASRLIQTVYPGGSSQENVYDDDGNEILTTDRHLIGAVIVGTRKFYDAAHHVVRIDRVQNPIVTITTENGVSRAKIQAEGTVVSTSATVINVAGRWSLISDPHTPNDPTNGTRTFYDAGGHIIRTERLHNVVISVTASGDISQSQLISDSGVISRSLNLYDANGDISLSIGADSQTTRSIVDSTTRQMLDSYDPLGGNTHFTYVDGKEVTRTDARNHTTNSDYYQNGALQQTTFADGSYTRYTYDLNGQKLTETLGTPANVERTTAYSYTDTSGNPDPHGNIRSVTLPTVTDPRTNTSVSPTYRYVWDAHGNLQDEIDPFNRTSSDTVVTYDAQGRKHATHHFATGPSESDVDDLLGRLDQHIDFRGQTTKYTYDAFGRVTTTDIYATGKVPGTDTPSERITNLYDALNRVIQVTDDYFDGSPRVTTYKYDQDGRQVQVNSPEGMIHYEYDSATGRLTEILTGIDSAVSINDYQRNHSTADTHYTYDELGRLKTLSLTRQMGNALAQPRQATYVYDEVGNQIEENLSNGVSTFNTYNSINELTNVTTRRGNIVLSSYAYNYGVNARREGATETRLEANGTTSTRTIAWGYDNLDRLISETVTSSVAGQSYTKTFILDLVGNRLRQTTTVTGQPTQQIDYYYDNDTNNLDATIPLGNNQLTREVGTLGGTADYQVVYHYDDNGSMDSKTRTGSAAETDVYVYDKQNRLQSAAIAGVTTTYGYDARGNRTVKTVGAQQTHYLVDNNNPTGVAQILAESALAAGTPSVSYFVGARVIAQNASGVTSFLTGDAEGSTRLLTDPVGEVQSRYDFDAFGNTVASSGPVTTSILYTGQQFDSGLKSYYLRSRYYDPAYGRFSTADSFDGDITMPQTLHRYLYANGDPINSDDPTGMFSSLNGLSAQAQITRIYITDHLGDKIVSAKLWYFGLFPDIQDWTTFEWLEVKPLTPTGISDAVDAIIKYAPGALFGWFPDRAWSPSTKTIWIGGKPEAIFNAGGIVFYGDQVQLVDEVVLGVSLLTARVIADFLPQAYEMLGRGIKAKQFQLSAELENTGGIATLNAELGLI